MNNEATDALIREVRKKKNLTQKELARRLHVTDQTVSRRERGAIIKDTAPISRCLLLNRYSRRAG